MKKRAVGFIAAGTAVVLVLVLGGGVAAELIIREKVEARVGTAVACAVGGEPSAVTTTVKGFPVATQAARGTLDDVTVKTSVAGRSMTIDMRDLSTNTGNIHASSASADVVVPWSSLPKVGGADAESTSGGAAVTAQSFSGSGSRITGVFAVSGRQVSVVFALAHTATAITLTAESIGVGGLELPTSSLDSSRFPALDKLADPRSISPKLPTGSTIKDVHGTSNGLRISVDLDLDRMAGTQRTTSAGTLSECASSSTAK
ncbi:Protein of unknown function [Curtobacterium sp. 314Chir4.1]|uniref:LmeA family phospholipid-binding protein n=1 Tax=Curtobacterium sp. 314Chir4.1 TaxID=1279028 RepID=UPI000BD8CD73|nr:DUF2993 domain-containing protein [Curtobacterium sp. 314Chir4.1]SOC88700.1 Protein of unknown function [Curtobacterium sp. 314Chir4.1]